MTDPPFEDVTDCELMALIAGGEGDVEATRELYRRFQSAVYSWLRKMTGDASRAEDLTRSLHPGMAEGRHLPA
jgi:hypothetical protein